MACSRGCRWLKNFAVTHQKTIRNSGLTAQNVIKHTSTAKILVSDHRRAAVLPRSAKWQFWLLPKLPRGAIKIKIYPEVQFAPQPQSQVRGGADDNDCTVLQRHYFYFQTRNEQHGEKRDKR